MPKYKLTATFYYWDYIDADCPRDAVQMFKDSVEYQVFNQNDGYKIKWKQQQVRETDNA